MKTRYLVFGILFVAILGIGWWAKDYFAIGQEIPQAREFTDTVQNIAENVTGNTNNDLPSNQPVEITVEPFVENVFVPWDIAFTSPDRMLFTERNGRIRQVVNGELSAQPIHTFSDVKTGAEEGLMGMVLDPNYETNKHVYTAYAYQSGQNMFVKIVRFTDDGDSISNLTTIIDKIPAAQYHAGTRMVFGPDGKLYVTTGDATDRQIAQQMDSLGGKILRMNPDGSIPSDNPFPNSLIYSLGHRNPQGLDWHPNGQLLFSTEHGPSGFDGAAGGDEVNIIYAGKNYGWPVVSHDRSRPEFESPKIVYTPAVAPASGMFYTADTIPQFKNNFFFGALRGEGIYRVILNESDPTQIVRYEKMSEVNFGRIREVAQGPDGYIYFSSSNRDGRGNELQGDDKIYLIRPR